MNLSITPVESSNIEGYAVVVNTDNKDLTLYIKFKSGAFYLYRNVPESVLVEFVDAESKGKYFAQHIKGHFDFEKVSTPDIVKNTHAVN